MFNQYKVFYKVMAIILTLTFMVNDLSFAASRGTACRAPTGSCMAPALRSKPVTGAPSDSIIQKAPPVLLWHTMGSAYIKGLELDQTVNLISETLAQRLVAPDTLSAFDWKNISKETREGRDVLVLPLTSGGRFVFTQEAYDPHYHLLKFDYPEGTVTVRAEDVDWGRPSAPQAVQETVVHKVPAIEQPVIKNDIKASPISDAVRRLLGLIRDLWGGVSRGIKSLWENPDFRTSVYTTGIAVAAYAVGLSAAALTGVPILLGMSCDRMFYYTELEDQMRRERLQTDKEIKEKVDEAKENIEEMGEYLDELSDTIADESREDFETEITDTEKHDIREVTIQAVSRYVKSGRKDKNFEEMISVLARDLQARVFKQDSVENVEAMLRRQNVKDGLKKVYDKADATIKPAVEPGQEGEGSALAQLTNMQKALLHQLEHMAQKLGLLRHHHHLLLLAITAGIGAYAVCKYVFGFGLDMAEYGALAMSVGIGMPGMPGGEEDPEEIIKQYTNDLDALAAERKIDDTYYLSSGVAMLNDQVANEACKNVFLVGDPIATQGMMEAAIVRKASLTNLKNAKFFEVNTARFIESLAIPGQLESDLRKLTNAFKQVYKNERIVLVLNFQDFFDMYKMKGGTGASLYFQLIEAIDAKNISVAILTNPELYERKLLKDKKLQDKFGTIDLKILPEYDLKRIARNHVRKLNDIYRCIIPEGVNVSMSRPDTELALYLSQKYYPKGLPVNKFHEVLDRVITGAFTSGNSLKARLSEIRNRLLKAGQELKASSTRNAPEKETEFLEMTVDRLMEEYEKAKSDIEANAGLLEKIKQDKKWEISLADVAKEISADTGIPLRDILSKEDDLLREYVPAIKAMLIGQDTVVEESYKAFMRRVNIGDSKNKPIGAYMLVGPTGVGKTEFARSLARHMFGNEEAMIRIDMSEYMNPIDAQKLIGSPPGYVGYEQGGILTEHVSRRPYSVVLLDEIEKADPSIFKLLLQMFEEGELRDGKGRITSFKNTIIIMTSNIGFSQPFSKDEERAKDMDKVIAYLDETLKMLNSMLADPELNRIVAGIRKGHDKLKEYLAKHGLTDEELESDLKEMGWVLSDNPMDKAMLMERKPFIIRYVESVRNAVMYSKNTDANKSYEYIARFKNTPAVQAEEKKAAREIDLLLKAEREVLRGLIYAFSENNMPVESDLVENYERIGKLLQIKDRRVKINGYIDHIRSTVRTKIIGSVKSLFSPELLNRIGLYNIISFDPLSKTDLEKILDIKLRGIAGLLKDEGFGELTLDKALRDKVIQDGYDIPNGARPLERALRKLVLAPLSDIILRKGLEKGKSIEAGRKGDEAIFTQKDREQKEGEVKHAGALTALKAADAAGEAELSKLLGVENAGSAEASDPGQIETLCEKYEIDIETGSDIPQVYVTDPSKINEELTKIEQKLTVINANLDQLNPLLQAARNQQQQQAITKQIVQLNRVKEQLTEAKNILTTRKSGNAQRAADMQKAFEENTKSEDDKARKALNDTFENLSVEALKGELEDFHPSFEGVSRIASVLKQQRRDYPLVLEDSLLMQKAVVDSFARNISDGTLQGFENTRILRLKLESMKEYFALVGMFESQMRKIIGAIEADDLKKGLKTVIVIDFDDIKNELERVRINPFMLGYFLRMFKGLETISFIMTTSREAIVNDDSFDNFFSLVSIPDSDKKDILENLYLFLKDSIIRKSNVNNGAKYDISFEAMDMSVKIWSQYPMGRDPIETMRKWFMGLLNKKKQEEAQVRMGLGDSLNDLREELMDLAQSGHITGPDLAMEPVVTGKIREINQFKEMANREKTTIIGPGDILDHAIRVEAAQSGVEIDRGFFAKDDNESLINVEDILARRVLNQSEAIKATARVLKIAKAGLKNKKSPIGTFIFAGPTGVGKTQLAKTVAKERGMSLLRIDMSEYRNPEDLSRLIGATAGYIGYLDDTGEVNEGLLYEHMRDNPKTVLLLDEVEKAHPAVLNILLQIMEDGRFTSNRGNTVKFDKSIIILTSNLGMETLKVGEEGRVVKESLYPEMEKVMRNKVPDREKGIAEFTAKMGNAVRAEAKKFFRPEFLNRIDQIVVFDPLPVESLSEIAAIFLKESAEAFRMKQGFDLVIGRNEEEAKAIYSYLADKGYQPENGARPMGEAVKKYFENRLVDYLVETRINLSKGDTITAIFDDGKMWFVSSKGGDKQAASLPEDDRKVLEAIAKHLKDNPAEPMTIEDLEEMFGFRKEVAMDMGEKCDIGGSAFVMNNTNFLKKEPVLKSLTDSVTVFLAKGNFTDTESETAIDAKKRTASVIENWIRDTVRVTKMANLEAFVYEAEKRIINDFYNLRREELENQSAQYIEKTGDKKTSELKLESKDGIVKAGITYNSRLTRALHRHIFVKEYKDDEDIGANAPRSLQGILKAKLAVEKLGGKMGFSSEEGNTTLWISFPLPEKVMPKPAAPVANDENTYLLKKTTGVSSKAMLRDMMRHFNLPSYGEYHSTDNAVIGMGGGGIMNEGLFLKLDSIGLFNTETVSRTDMTLKKETFLIYLPDENKLVLHRKGEKDIEYADKELCVAVGIERGAALGAGRFIDPYVIMKIPQAAYDKFKNETGSEWFAKGVSSQIEPFSAEPEAVPPVFAQPVSAMPGPAQTRKQPAIADMAKAIGADNPDAKKSKAGVSVSVGNGETISLSRSNKDLPWPIVKAEYKDEKTGNTRGFIYFGTSKRQLCFVDEWKDDDNVQFDVPDDMEIYFNVGKDPLSGKYYYEINKSEYDYFISKGCNLTFKNIETRVVPDEPQNETAGKSGKPKGLTKDGYPTKTALKLFGKILEGFGYGLTRNAAGNISYTLFRALFVDGNKVFNYRVAEPPDKTLVFTTNGSAEWRDLKRVWTIEMSGTKVVTDDGPNPTIYRFPKIEFSFDGDAFSITKAENYDGRWNDVSSGELAVLKAQLREIVEKERKAEEAAAKQKATRVKPRAQAAAEPPAGAETPQQLVKGLKKKGGWIECVIPEMTRDALAEVIKKASSRIRSSMFAKLDISTFFTEKPKTIEEMVKYMNAKTGTAGGERIFVLRTRCTQQIKENCNEKRDILIMDVKLEKTEEGWLISFNEVRYYGFNADGTGRIVTDGALNCSGIKLNIDPSQFLPAAAGPQAGTSPKQPTIMEVVQSVQNLLSAGTAPAIGKLDLAFGALGVPDSQYRERLEWNERSIKVRCEKWFDVDKTGQNKPPRVILDSCFTYIPSENKLVWTADKYVSLGQPREIPYTDSDLYFNVESVADSDGGVTTYVELDQKAYEFFRDRLQDRDDGPGFVKLLVRPVDTAGSAASKTSRTQPSIADMAKAIGADEKNKDANGAVNISLGDNEWLQVQLNSGGGGSGEGFVSVHLKDSDGKGYPALQCEVKRKNRAVTLYYHTTKVGPTIVAPVKLLKYFNIGMVQDIGRYYFEINKSAYDYFMSQGCNLKFRNIETRVVPDVPEQSAGNRPANQPLRKQPTIADMAKTIGADKLTQRVGGENVLLSYEDNEIDEHFDIKTDTDYIAIRCIDKATRKWHGLTYKCPVNGQRIVESVAPGILVRLPEKTEFYLNIGWDVSSRKHYFEINQSAYDYFMSEGCNLTFKNIETRVVPDVPEQSAGNRPANQPLRKQPTIADMAKAIGADNPEAKRSKAQVSVSAGDGETISVSRSTKKLPWPIVKVEYTDENTGNSRGFTFFGGSNRQLCFVDEWKDDDNAQFDVPEDMEIYFNVGKDPLSGKCYYEISKSEYDYFMSKGCDLTFKNIETRVVADAPQKETAEKAGKPLTVGERLARSFLKALAERDRAAVLNVVRQVGKKLRRGIFPFLELNAGKEIKKNTPIPKQGDIVAELRAGDGCAANIYKVTSADSVKGELRLKLIGELVQKVKTATMVFKDTGEEAVYKLGQMKKDRWVIVGGVFGGSSEKANEIVDPQSIDKPKGLTKDGYPTKTAIKFFGKILDGFGYGVRKNKGGIIDTETLRLIFANGNNDFEYRPMDTSSAATVYNMSGSADRDSSSGIWRVKINGTKTVWGSGPNPDIYRTPKIEFSYDGDAFSITSAEYYDGRWNDVSPGELAVLKAQLREIVEKERKAEEAAAAAREAAVTETTESAQPGQQPTVESIAALFRDVLKKDEDIEADVVEVLKRRTKSRKYFEIIEFHKDLIVMEREVCDAKDMAVRRMELVWEPNKKQVKVCFVGSKVAKYDKPYLYFNMKRGKGKSAIVELNQAAYDYFTAKGLKFERIKIVPVEPPAAEPPARAGKPTITEIAANIEGVLELMALQATDQVGKGVGDNEELQVFIEGEGGNDDAYIEVRALYGSSGEARKLSYFVEGGKIGTLSFSDPKGGGTINVPPEVRVYFNIGRAEDKKYYVEVNKSALDYLRSKNCNPRFKNIEVREVLDVPENIVAEPAPPARLLPADLGGSGASAFASQTQTAVGLRQDKSAGQAKQSTKEEIMKLFEGELNVGRSGKESAFTIRGGFEPIELQFQEQKIVYFRKNDMSLSYSHEANELRYTCEDGTQAYPFADAFFGVIKGATPNDTRIVINDKAFNIFKDVFPRVFNPGHIIPFSRLTEEEAAQFTALAKQPTIKEIMGVFGQKEFGTYTVKEVTDTPELVSVTTRLFINFKDDTVVLGHTKYANSDKGPSLTELLSMSYIAYSPGAKAITWQKGSDPGNVVTYRGDDVFFNIKKKGTDSVIVEMNRKVMELFKENMFEGLAMEGTFKDVEFALVEKALAPEAGAATPAEQSRSVFLEMLDAAADRDDDGFRRMLKQLLKTGGLMSIFENNAVRLTESTSRIASRGDTIIMLEDYSGGEEYRITFSKVTDVGIQPAVIKEIETLGYITENTSNFYPDQPDKQMIEEQVLRNFDFFLIVPPDRVYVTGAESQVPVTVTPVYSPYINQPPTEKIAEIMKTLGIERFEWWKTKQLGELRTVTKEFGTFKDETTYRRFVEFTPDSVTYYVLKTRVRTDSATNTSKEISRDLSFFTLFPDTKTVFYGTYDKQFKYEGNLADLVKFSADGSVDMPTFVFIPGVGKGIDANWAANLFSLKEASEVDVPTPDALPVSGGVMPIMKAMGYEGYDKGEYAVYEAKPINPGEEEIKESFIFSKDAFEYMTRKTKPISAGSTNTQSITRLVHYDPEARKIILSGGVKTPIFYKGNDLTFEVDNSGYLPRFIIPAHIFKKLVDDGAGDILIATRVFPADTTTKNERRSPNNEYIETYYTPTPAGIYAARIIPQSAGQFNMPGRVTTNDAGKIFVKVVMKNTGNEALIRLNIDGTFETSMGVSESPDDKASIATTTDKDGNIFTIDSQKRTVRVLKPSGDANEDYGPGGIISQRAGRFGESMAGIAIGNDGAIIVSDQNGHYLSIVNKVGEKPSEPDEVKPIPADEPEDEPDEYKLMSAEVESAVQALTKLSETDPNTAVKNAAANALPLIAPIARDNLEMLVRVAGAVARYPKPAVNSMPGLVNVARDQGTQDNLRIKAITDLALLAAHAINVNENRDKAYGPLYTKDGIAEALQQILREAMYRDEPDVELGRKAIQALKALGHDYGRAISVLETILSDIQGRWEPLYADAIETLKAIASSNKIMFPDLEYTVNDVAVMALTNFAKEIRNKDKTALRIAAIEAAGEIVKKGNEKAVKRAIDGLYLLINGENKYSEVAKKAIEVLGEIGRGDLSVKLCLSEIVSGRKFNVIDARKTALEAVAKVAIGDERAAEELMDYMRGSDFLELRIAAAKALAGISPDKRDAISWLESIIDGDASVTQERRTEAAIALGSIDPGNPRGIKPQTEQANPAPAKAPSINRLEAMAGNPSLPKRSRIEALGAMTQEDVAALDNEERALVINRLTMSIIDDTVTDLDIRVEAIRTLCRIPEFASDFVCGPNIIDDIRKRTTWYISRNDTSIVRSTLDTDIKGIGSLTRAISELAGIETLKAIGAALSKELFVRTKKEIEDKTEQRRTSLSLADLSVKYILAVRLAEIVAVTNRNDREAMMFLLETAINDSLYVGAGVEDEIRIRNLIRAEAAMALGRAGKWFKEKAPETKPGGGNVSNPPQRTAKNKFANIGADLSPLDQAMRDAGEIRTSPFTNLFRGARFWQGPSGNADGVEKDGRAMAMKAAAPELTHVANFAELLDKGTPRSIIMYADDILKNAVLYDFDETLKVMAQKDMLSGGKIMLYVKDAKYMEQAGSLAHHINATTAGKITAMVVKSEDLRRTDTPAAEAESLVRMAERQKCGKALAIIRGNGIDWAKMFKEYDISTPMIIINDNVKGLFLFSQALLLAMEAEIANADVGNVNALGWIRCLDPIEILTDKMYGEYLRYRDEVLVKA